MSSPEVKGLTGHNSSPQEGVAQNPDPALDLANEHHHSHLHHGALTSNTTKHPDEVVYSNASPEKSFDKPHDYAAAEKMVTDEESGKIGRITADESEERRGPTAYYYRRYRAYVHIFIWAVFTA